MNDPELRFHYSIPLEDVSYNEFAPDPKRSDPDETKSYQWLMDKLGFWPVFTSVGNSVESYWITGYDNNWSRIIGYDNNGTVYRKAGEYPNLVLFSFESLEGVFMDYCMWFIVLNSANISKDIGVVVEVKRIPVFGS